MRADGKNSAFWFLVVALLGAGVITLHMKSNLLPQRENWIIWTLSVTVLFVGLLRACHDIWRLRLEWAALDLLQRNVPVATLASGHRGTAISERARRVAAANAERRVEREFRQSNRAEAAAMLDTVGTITRFLGSSLLVLAVMGTFAGMKSALPYLQRAITNAGQASTSGGQEGFGAAQIGIALEGVSDAFGANFVALFGSLFLGSAAFGAILERRRLLSRIEYLSERHLYRELPADADASELQMAVSELQRSVTKIGAIAGAVENLGGGIADLKVVLRDTLSEMHTSFSDGVRRHGVELQTQLNTTVTDLTVTLGGTSKALQTTAVAYQGLVKGLEERDLGIARATTALESGIAQFLAVHEVSVVAAANVANASKDVAAAASQAAELGLHAHETLTLAGTHIVSAGDRLAAVVDAQARRLAEIASRIIDLREDQETTRTVVAEELRGIRGELQIVSGRTEDLANIVRVAEADAAVQTSTAVRESLSTLDSAFARFAAETETMANRLDKRLHEVHQVISAGTGATVGSIEGLQGLAVVRADQSEALRVRGAQQVDVLKRELIALREDVRELSGMISTGRFRVGQKATT